MGRWAEHSPLGSWGAWRLISPGRGLGLDEGSSSGEAGGVGARSPQHAGGGLTQASVSALCVSQPPLGEGDGLQLVTATVCDPLSE